MGKHSDLMQMHFAPPPKKIDYVVLEHSFILLILNIYIADSKDMNFFKKYSFVMIFTTCSASNPIEVLTTSRNLSSRIPNSGADIKHPSLAGLEDVTICARFNTYQFSVHEVHRKLPKQAVLSFSPGDAFFSSWTMLEGWAK